MGGDAAYGGGKLTLALLEEAKLWTAILLRLARKLPTWKAQAPMLAEVSMERFHACSSWAFPQCRVPSSPRLLRTPRLWCRVCVVWSGREMAAPTAVSCRGRRVYSVACVLYSIFFLALCLASAVCSRCNPKNPDGRLACICSTWSSRSRGWRRL